MEFEYGFPKFPEVTVSVNGLPIRIAEFISNDIIPEIVIDAENGLEYVSEFDLSCSAKHNISQKEFRNFKKYLFKLSRKKKKKTYGSKKAKLQVQKRVKRNLPVKITLLRKAGIICQMK